MHQRTVASMRAELEKIAGGFPLLGTAIGAGLGAGTGALSVAAKKPPESLLGDDSTPPEPKTWQDYAGPVAGGAIGGAALGAGTQMGVRGYKFGRDVIRGAVAAPQQALGSLLEDPEVLKNPIVIKAMTHPKGVGAGIESLGVMEGLKGLYGVGTKRLQSLAELGRQPEVVARAKAGKGSLRQQAAANYQQDLMKEMGIDPQAMAAVGSGNPMQASIEAAEAVGVPSSKILRNTGDLDQLMRQVPAAPQTGEGFSGLSPGHLQQLHRPNQKFLRENPELASVFDAPAVLTPEQVRALPKEEQGAGAYELAMNRLSGKAPIEKTKVHYHSLVHVGQLPPRLLPPDVQAILNRVDQPRTHQENLDLINKMAPPISSKVPSADPPVLAHHPEDRVGQLEWKIKSREATNADWDEYEKLTGKR